MELNIKFDEKLMVELIKRLRELQTITEHCGEQSCDECENRELCDKHDNKTLSGTYKEAADAIEDLIAERDKYKRHSDSISQLPDCNTCGKKAKGSCEFMPAYGDWVRINCAFWVPEPPKEE